MGIIAISGKARSGKDLIGKVIPYLIYCDKFKLDISFEDYAIHSIGYVSPWKIIKFADKLKDIVCLLIGCSRSDLEDETFKNTELGEEWDKYIQYDKVEDIWNNCKKDTYDKLYIKYPNSVKIIKMTPRHCLQRIGTDLFRKQFHTQTWVNATMADYRPVLNKWDKEGNNILPNWIITDSRFENEVKVVKDRGGINIRVNRKYKCSLCGSRNTRPKIGGVKCDECDKFASYTPSQMHESETNLDFYDKFDYTIENNGNIDHLVEQVRGILKLENII